jgi:GDP-L-fucose synthase
MKVLVTGGRGFLGRHVIDELINRGVNRAEIYAPSSLELNLLSEDNCRKALKGADICIHLAARVGGIGLNNARPADLFFDNMKMGLNIIHVSQEMKLTKLVVVGTICAYPKMTSVPFKEDDLWCGYPEETNAPYGIAKKSLLVYLQACRKQYGLNGIFLLPVNLYGPGDNFSPESSHVIPALIKKFYDAKENNDNEVVVWGTGKATREFLYVKDCAEAIVKATIMYDKPDPINVGAGFEISIKDLVDKISCLMDYKGKIVWDTTKPDGQPRRMLDTSKAEAEFGFKALTTFDAGLTTTINWYSSTRRGNGTNK